MSRPSWPVTPPGWPRRTTSTPCRSTRTAARCSATPADAADAVQDTFLVATAKLHSLRDPGKLRAWLYTVARNECLRRLRAGHTLSALEEAPDLPTQTGEVGIATERAELQELVRAAIDGLNPGERDLIELSLVADLDGDELADALGVSRNYAHARLSRARSQLERSLGALIVARTGRTACPDLGRHADRLGRSADRADAQADQPAHRALRGVRGAQAPGADVGVVRSRDAVGRADARVPPAVASDAGRSLACRASAPPDRGESRRPVRPQWFSQAHQAARKPAHGTAFCTTRRPCWRARRHRSWWPG